VGVQDPPRERGKRDEPDQREHPPRERHALGHRLRREPRRKHGHVGRGEQDAEGAQDGEEEEEVDERRAGEGIAFPPLPRLGVDGEECRGDSPFPEDLAQRLGDEQGDEERIVPGGGAEGVGDRGIADQASEPRHDRPARPAEDVPQKRPPANVGGAQGRCSLVRGRSVRPTRVHDGRKFARVGPAVKTCWDSGGCPRWPDRPGDLLVSPAGTGIAGAATPCGPRRAARQLALRSA